MRVRAAWKVKSSRKGSVDRWTAAIQGRVLHLISSSPHAIAHYAANANGYRNVRRFLEPSIAVAILDDGRGVCKGGREWAGNLGPCHLILDPSHNLVNAETFTKVIMENFLDGSGRLRKNLARKGILNPDTLMQKILRHVALHAPKQADGIFEECFNFLYRCLRKEFPGAVIMVAFHLTTGRPHWEWIVSGYGQRGKIARREPEWDGKTRSIQHAKAFLKTGRTAPGGAPKLNSQIEMGMYRVIYRRLKVLEREVEIPPLTKVVMLKADIFFLELQRASLLDGIKSKNAKRAKKAKLEWERNAEELRKAERRLKVYLINQDHLKAAVVKDNVPTRSPRR